MGPVPAELAVLKLMLTDLERTVATQIATGETIDEKAARIIGWNGLLLGLLVTAASFAVEHGTFNGAPRWALIPVGAASLNLLGSVWFAVRTYRATEYRVGLEPADLMEATAYDMDEDAHIAMALEGYRDAHDHNKRSLDRSSTDFTWALLAFFAALLLATASATLFLWHGGAS